MKIRPGLLVNFCNTNEYGTIIANKYIVYLIGDNFCFIIMCQGLTSWPTAVLL